MENDNQTNLETSVKAYNRIPQSKVGEFPIVPLMNGVHEEFRAHKGLKALFVGTKENTVRKEYVSSTSNTDMGLYFDRPVVPSHDGELVYFKKN